MGEIEIRVIPIKSTRILFGETNKLNTKFERTIREMTNQGWTLVHNSRVGGAGGTLTFQREKPSPTSRATPRNFGEPDLLEMLVTLRDAGLLSKEEFEAKEKRLPPRAGASFLPPEEGRLVICSWCGWKVPAGKHNCPRCSHVLN
ncbi:MAG: SHOCT domain-containing protein [Actinomycetota bacterium]